MKPELKRALDKFVRGLDEGQAVYFSRKLPVELRAWFQSDFVKRERSQPLELTAAAPYSRLNALAVALLHLRNLFPVKVPSVLYRLTNLDYDPGDGNIVTLTPDNSRRYLLSFSGRKDPQIEDREVNFDKVDGILMWKPRPELVLGSMRQFKVMVPTLVEYFKILNDKDATNQWKRLSIALKGFEDEDEFMVYLQPNKPLKCRWKELRNPKSFEARTKVKGTTMSQVFPKSWIQAGAVPKAELVKKPTVASRMDMSAEVAGQGLDPVTKRPMVKMLANGHEVLVGMESRIVLPTAD